MSLGSSSAPAIDPAMQQFLHSETEKQKVQAVVHELNEKCWDTCMDKPSSKLDSRTEACLKNCVDRFLDMNILVAERLEKKASELLHQHDNLGL